MFNNKDKFADILIRIKTSYGSMTNFAKKSSLDRTYLSKYINKKLEHPPSPDILRKIADNSNGITNYIDLMYLCDYFNDSEYNHYKLNFKKEPKVKKPNDKILGVDFDGTLAVTKGTYPEIQKPIQEVVDYVLDQQEKGVWLILITMREGQELEQAVEWCKQQGIFFDAVNDNLDFMKEFFNNNPRKIFCNEYLDDTNMGGIEYIIQEIKKRQETY